MRRTGIHFGRTILHQCRRGFHQRAPPYRSVVDDQAGIRPLTSPITCHSLRHVHFHAAFVDDRQEPRHFTSSRKTAPAPRRPRPAKPPSDSAGSVPEVIHPAPAKRTMVPRNIKKPLQLRRVQVYDQRPVRPPGRQQIRHQLRRKGAARLVFAVLPRIAEIRASPGRNSPCRRALQRIDHQQQLHQVLVDARAFPTILVSCAAGRLHYKTHLRHVRFS